MHRASEKLPGESHAVAQRYRITRRSAARASQVEETVCAESRCLEWGGAWEEVKVMWRLRSQQGFGAQAGFFPPYNFMPLKTTVLLRFNLYSINLLLKVHNSMVLNFFIYLKSHISVYLQSCTPITII